MLAPRSPAPAIFLRHGDNAQAICKHVKSIVRPAKVGARWLNVHAFDVKDYRNSDGDEFHWGHIPGVTALSPTWLNAKVMHLQLRSMEQFVERCKRRSDILPERSLFDYLDQNNICDPSPREKLPAMLAFKRAVLAWIAENKEGSAQRPFQGDWTWSRLITAHGDIVSLRPDGSLSIFGDEAILCYSMRERKAFFYSEGPSFGISNVFFAQVFPIEKEIVLQLPSSLLYLTAIPIEHGGSIESNREVVDQWERFKIDKLLDSPNELAIQEAYFINSTHPFERILLFRNSSEELASFLAPLLLDLADENEVAGLAQILALKRDPTY